MKVLYNNCYGGLELSIRDLFLSTQLTEELFFEDFNLVEKYRTDPAFIEKVEKVLEKSKYESYDIPVGICDIPDGVMFEIEEYDGMETVVTFLEITKDQLIKGLTPELAELATKCDYVKIKE